MNFSPQKRSQQAVLMSCAFTHLIRPSDTLFLGRIPHLSFLFAHMSKEAWVKVKIVKHSFFPGQHFTNVMRDRVCLNYALMIGMPLNYRAIFQMVMRKAKTHKGRRYDFGSLITALCYRQGSLKKRLITARSSRPPYVATNVKGPNVSLGPILTMTERAYRDKLIAGCMYGLEILRHRTGGRPSMREEL